MWAKCSTCSPVIHSLTHSLAHLLIHPFTHSRLSIIQHKAPSTFTKLVIKHNRGQPPFTPLQHIYLGTTPKAELDFISTNQMEDNSDRLPLHTAAREGNGKNMHIFRPPYKTQSCLHFRIVAKAEALLKVRSPSSLTPKSDFKISSFPSPASSHQHTDRPKAIYKEGRRWALRYSLGSIVQ